MDYQYDDSSLVSSSDNSNSDLEYKTCGKIAQLVLTKLEYLVDGLPTLQRSAPQGEEHGCHSRSSPVQIQPDNWDAQGQDNSRSMAESQDQGQDSESMDDSNMSTCEMDEDQDIIENKYQGQDNLDEHGQCSDHYSLHPIEMIVIKSEEVVGGEECSVEYPAKEEIKKDIKVEKEEEDDDDDDDDDANQQAEENGGGGGATGRDVGTVKREELHDSCDVKRETNAGKFGEIDVSVKVEDELILSDLELHDYWEEKKGEEQNGGMVDEGLQVKKEEMEEDPLMHIESFSSHSSDRSSSESHTPKHLEVEDLEIIEGGGSNGKYHSSSRVLQIQDFSSDIVHAIRNKKSKKVKEAKQKYSLIHNLRTHTGERPFSCVFCDRTFNHKSKLTRHLHTHTGERPYNCDFCDKTFTKKSHLTTHLRTHTGERPYSCEFCDKSFIQKSVLTTHLYTHTGERPYSCEFCDKTFNHKSHLTTHSRTHTGERPYSCEFCDKTFNQKSVLTRHLHTHTGERPYNCDFCDKTFNQKSILTTHLYTHTGERLFSCEFCDKTFNHKSQLTRHLHTHTGERPYNCEVCGNTFIQKSHLTLHSRTHTGESPYNCEFCDKTFKQKSNLTIHLYTHTGKRPFSCGLCNHKTTTKSNLMKHLRKHR